MNNFKVPIKNILYMYSYIWEKVDTKDRIEIDALDDFESSNIYAELFLINIHKILKKGILNIYEEKEEEIKGIKGKINFKESLNKLSFLNAKSVCNYDEMETNNIYNQILKTTAIKLYSSNNLNVVYKKKLNEVIQYLSQIDRIEINENTFKKLKFNKNNSYYFYLLKICELINMNLMLSQANGKYTFLNIFENEDNMHSIFELFINRFYKYELGNQYSVAFQKQLTFNVTGGNQNLLPLMKLDTLITGKDETIILDTKYYKNYLLENYETKKFRNGHIYQMLSYMNNIKLTTKNLRGILLYPRPFDEESINEIYEVKVIVKDFVKDATIQFLTIDLNEDWEKIKENLLKIIE